MQGNSQELFSEAFEKVRNPQTQKLQHEWEQKSPEEIAFALKTYTRDVILPSLHESGGPTNVIEDVEAILDTCYQKVAEAASTPRQRQRSASMS